MQARDEPAEGPRLCALKHAARGGAGTLFANVAAERQLPALTGLRLAKRAGEAAKMQPLTEQEWRADERQLIMRPPTLLVLPLSGFCCDAPGWHEWQWRDGPAGLQ